jgi:hypothetical protein
MIFTSQQDVKPRMTSTHNDHSIQEYNLNVKFQQLKDCRCCTKHNENKPTELIWKVFIPSIKVEPSELTCECECRHIMRWMCRDCVPPGRPE